MTNTIMASPVAGMQCVRAGELHSAATGLRRIANLARFAPPLLVAWLANSAGVAWLTTLKLALCAFVVALPVAWVLGIAASAVHASALVAEHEHDTGVRMISPLDCRG